MYAIFGARDHPVLAFAASRADHAFAERYSQRSATSGSTFVARLAGTDAAMNATRTNRTVAPMNVIGSSGPVSNVRRHAVLAARADRSA